MSLTKLDKLDHDSNFEPNSWLQLFEALSKNSTLTKLDLSGVSGLDNEVNCVCLCVSVSVSECVFVCVTLCV